MKRENGGIYRFGEFELDADNRQLSRDGRQILLQAKAFDLLLTLVEHNGRLVEKDDLLSLVWRDQFVEESNLTVHISQIRKALGDNRRNPKYIVTVPGYGYRFEGDISEENGEQYLLETEEYSRITIDDRVEDQGDGTERKLTRGGGQWRRSWQWHVLSGFLGLLLVASGTYWFLANEQKGKATVVSEAVENELNIRRLTNSGRVNRVKLSPDGRFFAYTLRERGSYQTELRLGQVDGGSNVLLREAGGISHYPITFSSDGNWLYYVETQPISEYKYSTGTFYRMPILNGVPQKLGESVSVFAALSQDEKQIVFPRESKENKTSAIVVADIDGSNEREIVVRPSSQSIDLDSLSWSADGQYIAFSASTDNSTGDASVKSYEIFVVLPTDRVVIQLTALNWNRVLSLEWLKDGTGLVAVGRDSRQQNTSSLWLIEYPGGNARRISRDVHRYAGTVSLSNDSTTLAAIQSQIETNIWVAPITDLSESTQITFSSSGRQDGWHGVDWTPDGRIVYTAWIDESSTVWIMNADGTDPRQLTSVGFRDEKPTVAGNGRFIVFQSNRSGAMEIWRMDIDAGSLQQLTRDGGNSAPSLTPDGLWVIYRHSIENDSSLWRISTSGDGAPFLITHDETLVPRVSPNGRLVACGIRFGEEMKMAIYSIDGGEPLKVLDLPKTYNFRFGGIRWSPDSRSVSYPDEANGIWIQDLEAGSAERFKGIPAERTYSYAWSPDGEQFAFGRQREARDVVLIRDFK